MNDMESQRPREGYGFIYVLQNPSHPSIQKVGLTTNSLRERIDQLSSSGVPKRFEAAAKYQIKIEHLQTVEKKSHQKLKAMGYHDGKEFFKCSVRQCKEIIEDAILLETGSDYPDLVAEALKREHRRQEIEEKKRTQKEKDNAQIREFNRTQENKRQKFITSKKSPASKTEKPLRVLQAKLESVLGYCVIAIVGGVVGMAIGNELLACIGAVVAVVIVNFLEAGDQQKKEEDHRIEAAEIFPLANSVHEIHEKKRWSNWKLNSIYKFFTCPSCSSKLRIKSGVTSAPKFKITCPNCHTIFVRDNPADAAEIELNKRIEKVVNENY